jgi:hypothetical protein
VPIHKLNCGVVWTAELDSPGEACEDGSGCGGDVAAAAATGGGLPELDKPEYSGKIEDDWIVEKLLAQGGVRLAGILNAIFAPHR